MTLAGRRYWLVGASEGLGLALARQMHERGVRLILSARDGARLEQACRDLPGAEPLPLDVGDAGAVARAAETVGEIDGLIWLAGVYWPMSARAVDAAQLEQMCDINFTGCARVIASVLPGMVARNRGHLVLTGSLSAYRGLPGAMGYQASKAGVMALGECLQADLRGTGVKVQIANPGFIRTRLTAKNDFAMPFLMEPEAAAREMIRLMAGNALQRAFPVPFSWLFRLSRLLPDWAYYPLFSRH